MSERKYLPKKHEGLPLELQESLDNLVNSFNSGKELLDCELSDLLGTINVTESWGSISTGLAKEMRQMYIYDVLEGKYGEIL